MVMPLPPPGAHVYLGVWGSHQLLRRVQLHPLLWDPPHSQGCGYASVPTTPCDQLVWPLNLTTLQIFYEDRRMLTQRVVAVWTEVSCHWRVHVVKRAV